MTVAQLARDAVEIRLDGLEHPDVHALLAEHLRNMHELSPPESVHALGIEALRQPDVTFWTGWLQDHLLACGALKELTPVHGEIKSMRTAATHRRRGAARLMLEHIIGEARRRSYARLSLETGASAAFAPARHLYQQFGFSYCGPFGDYGPDPNSTFMTRRLP